jgi:hypothetical protein
MAHRAILLVAFALCPAANGRTFSGGRTFLGAEMQPEVVARTLRNVEEEWKAQAALFAQCDNTDGKTVSLVDCSDAPASFSKSCSIVVGAVVQGSNGDKHVAKEYMTDVCSQTAIKGWHQDKCNSLATAISGAMSADTYQNRYGFNSNKLCTSFWSTFLKEEQQDIAKEKAEREASEKKAAEEEKAAQEAEKKKACRGG